ncbi:MAG: ABC transporter ATP-binding protein [Oscillospiraceae bacterium]|nr:ABC transporter ATP-binding protein [Oscillospiraceae bacterium]
MDAIRTVNLTKKYGDTIAVQHLNLQIRQGELFSLLGVNGAGKSTVIKMLSCLTQPTEGDAFLNEKSICKNASAIKSFIAVSPQESAIAPGLSVRENLELVCGIYGLDKNERRERVAELSHQLGLTHLLEKKARHLSGGWQRRLSIAMALITQPEILFLDEPTLGLDVLARSDLWELIRSLKGKVTIVLTTHYLQEAEALSDRIAIMKEGRVLICGTAEEIKKKTDTDDFEKAFIRVVKEAEK